MIQHKYAIFTIAAISAILSVGMISNQAEATSVFTWQMVQFEDWDETQSYHTYRSSISNMETDLDEEGAADLYAKDRSTVSNPQAAIEYTKVITVESGDELLITQYTYLDYASFYKQDAGENSHVTAFPTIHEEGESSTVGYTNLTGCDNPVFTEIVAYTTNLQLTSTMVCDDLDAGDYEISAYVHTRANENAPNDNASTSADVSDIELSVRVTSP